jgi:hypothetical protein
MAGAGRIRDAADCPKPVAGHGRLLLMRTSQTLASLVARLRSAGLEAEATLVEAEAARVSAVETMLDAVLGGLEEPICFPARRVRGTQLHAATLAQAAD